MEADVLIFIVFVALALASALIGVSESTLANQLKADAKKFNDRLAVRLSASAYKRSALWFLVAALMLAYGLVFVVGGK